MLTAKQDKFCLNMATGMTQIDAYKNSFDAENMSDNSISREASLLMNNPKITQRIEELRKDMYKDTIMTTIQKKEFLTNMILKDAQANRTDKLKAIDILNKMDGEYITKIEANVELADIRVELRDE